MLEFAVATVLFAALVLYTLTGGADFGGGLWDALARGPRAEAQRTLIARTLAPIWEANHVWLIVAVVVLFVAFPGTFAMVMTWLHVPLVLALIGIVLRGAAFSFRAYGMGDANDRQRWGRVFGIASTATPVALGLCVGAIVSGQLPLLAQAPPTTAGFFAAWTTPFAAALGLFALALVAELSAAYLCLETSDPALQDDFRRRGLISGALAGLAAFAALAAAPAGAPAVWSKLAASPAAIPFHATVAGVSLGVLAALGRRRFALARGLAIAQVVAVLAGWAWVQAPALVVGGPPLGEVAAPASVLRPLLLVLAVGGLLVAPAFVALYRVFTGAAAQDR